MIGLDTPLPHRVRTVDDRGRYAGTLVLLELGGATPWVGPYWTARWAGQTARWSISTPELERLVEPARVRA